MHGMSPTPEEYAAADLAVLTVTCPRCDAAPGAPCHTSERVERSAHRRRFRAWLAANGAAATE
jgi:hypothetical protein